MISRRGDHPIVAGNAVGTAVFIVTAVLAAAFLSTPLQWAGAITALALFAVGVFAFLWSYVQAVQRSRTDDITVTGLYLLAGGPTPTEVRRTMLVLLVAQIVTAAATTLARPDGPDGDPGSSLAVGFLVPMFGLGLNGLLAARHGTFPPRRRVDGRPADDAVDQVGEGAAGGAAIGQNDAHG